MKEPKTPGNPLSPEILSLIDKVAKDPQSKLFMPLAEEYMKCGMLDEAMMVLNDGLEVYPNFFSAKVTLGKVYLKKDQVEDAKAQFEEVVQASPDNLFAHRKLAKIYRDENDLERARTSCRVVLSANPKDAEIKSLMDEIEHSFQETAGLSQETKAGVLENQPQEHLEASTVSGTGSLEDAMPLEPTFLSAEEPVSILPEEVQEEIATESLADIYIKQGHYEKGMEIYKKLLSQNPSNKAIARKLEETEYLKSISSKDLGLQPAHDQQEASSAQTEELPSFAESPAYPDPDQSAAQDSTGPATIGPGEIQPSGKRDRTVEKIKKLEAWLESIRRERAK
jgi:tetratricopeptide (TPR) repeat protein